MQTLLHYSCSWGYVTVSEQKWIQCLWGSASFCCWEGRHPHQIPAIRSWLAPPHVSFPFSLSSVKLQTVIAYPRVSHWCRRWHLFNVLLRKDGKRNNPSILDISFWGAKGFFWHFDDRRRQLCSSSVGLINMDMRKTSETRGGEKQTGWLWPRGRHLLTLLGVLNL